MHKTTYLRGLLVLSSLLLGIAQANARFCINGLWYEKGTNQTVKLVDYDKDYDQEIIIRPTVSSYDGTYHLTEIGSYALENCLHLYALELPNTVQAIGTMAFKGCDNLSTITVENGNSVFDARSSCNAIVETSTNRLVVGCQNSIVAEGVVAIGADAFNDCQNLTEIELPESLERIESGAFMSCPNLTALRIPNSVRELGEMMVANCPNLQVLEVEATNAFFYSQNNAIIEKGTQRLVVACSASEVSEEVESIGAWSFFGCLGLDTLALPEGVTQIEAFAFHSCGDLVQVSLPQSLTTIEQAAFMSCYKIAELTVFNPAPEPINVNTFADEVYNTAVLKVPNEAVAYFKSSTGWKKFRHIQPLNTALEMLENEAESFIIYNGFIENLGDGRIFDPMGRELTNLNGSLKGLYIVLKGGRAVKVWVP